MSITAATDPQTELWEKVAFYLRHAFSLFGDPAALAQRLWLTRRDHKQFADFIRPLEEIVRRVIFIMALGLSPMTLPPAPERKYRARLALPANAGASFDADKPETWRVSFKLAATSDRRLPAGNQGDNTHQPCRQDAGAPESRLSSAPSAERLEALVRAYENRDKLAAALARKIARNARAALPYIARPSAERAHKAVYDTLFEIIPRAIDAHQSFIQRKNDAVAPDSS